MAKVRRLAVAFLREHPTRAVLTTVATVAAALMVVWIVSGYDALLQSFDNFANAALGRYPLAVAPISQSEPLDVPPQVVADLRADPAVERAEPMWTERTPVRPLDAEGRPRPEPTRSPAGPRVGFGALSGPPGLNRNPRLMATDSPDPPFDLTAGRWLDPSATAPETVVRADTAARMNLSVGDLVEAGDGDHRRTLTVVGIVGAPAISPAAENMVVTVMTPSLGEFYVTTAVAEQVLGRPAGISLVGVSLRPDADLTRFRFGWAPRLSRYATPVQFQEAYEIEEALDESAAARNVQMQSWAATGIAMLVAFLVIFCTLNMGVTERVRQFAILRAVGLTRRQVALLVFAESFLLATLGLLGGLAVGWALLQVVARASAKTLHHGATVGPYTLLLASLAVYGGAAIAALIPAIRATRVKPVDAMALQVSLAASGAVSPLAVVVGLLLVAVNPLLAFAFPPPFESGVVVSLAVGFAAMSVGFVLLAPAVVVFVDRRVGPLLARLLAIDPKLLASQLTSHLWRTAGAALSLAVGAGLYVGVLVWGHTMLEGFVPGPWAPDALVAFRPDGVDRDAVRKVADIDGVDERRCEPIVVEQPRLLEDVTGSADRASVTRQDNVVLVGIDPAKAFGGGHPLFRFEWVAGSPETAVPQLTNGRGCLVPDHFLTETDLKLGDSFALVPPENAAAPVRYTIVGAVRLPGWHWQTKLTGFRPRTHRAAALVFAGYDHVARDFALPAATHVWFRFDTPAADPQTIAESARALYQTHLGREVTVGGNRTEGPSVQVMPVEDIRRTMRGAAGRWMWLLSQVPLVALVITSFGVLNVMLASVRARRWELGVLRALGFTRGEIVRAILAEGLLVGVVAGILSLGFGVLGGWCGCGFAQYVSFFGGLHPDLVVPPVPILLGLTALLTLAFLAAAWPAIDTARTRPLALLQKGRGGF